MRGIVRFDLQTGSAQEHPIPPGDQNSEPVFVPKHLPKQEGTDEDDGWVLVCVYRGQTHSSELLILDAQDISAPPLARIDLQRRIPAGFHGAWVAN